MTHKGLCVVKHQTNKQIIKMIEELEGTLSSE